MTPEEAIEWMCKELNLRGGINALRSKTKKFGFPKKRHLMMFVLRAVYELSYNEIGMLFDRDHSVVIHGIKQVNNVTNPGIEDQAIEFISKLKGYKHKTLWMSYEDTKVFSLFNHVQFV
jgi:chromosomal replication initiation ATPase DnaA